MRKAVLRNAAGSCAVAVFHIALIFSSNRGSKFPCHVVRHFSVFGTMSSTAEAHQPEALEGTLNEAPEMPNPNAASATGTPLGVPGATPKAPDHSAPKSPAQGAE